MTRGIVVDNCLVSETNVGFFPEVVFPGRKLFYTKTILEEVFGISCKNVGGALYHRALPKVMHPSYSVLQGRGRDVEAAISSFDHRDFETWYGEMHHLLLTILRQKGVGRRQAIARHRDELIRLMGPSLYHLTFVDTITKGIALGALSDQYRHTLDHPVGQDTLHLQASFIDSDFDRNDGQIIIDAIENDMYFATKNKKMLIQLCSHPLRLYLLRQVNLLLVLKGVVHGDTTSLDAAPSKPRLEDVRRSADQARAVSFWRPRPRQCAPEALRRSADGVPHQAGDRGQGWGPAYAQAYNPAVYVGRGRSAWSSPKPAVNSHSPNLLHL